jgi:hypothetical protein
MISIIGVVYSSMSEKKNNAVPIVASVVIIFHRWVYRMKRLQVESTVATYILW